MGDKYITEFDEETSPSTTDAVLIDQGSGSYKYATIANIVPVGGYWTRTGTTLSTKTAGDNVEIGGTLDVTGLSTFEDNIKIDSTLPQIFGYKSGVNSFFIKYDTNLEMTANFGNAYLKSSAVGSHTGLVTSGGVALKVYSDLSADFFGDVDIVGDLEMTGVINPASLADASASNGSIYYSTTQSKLVFKDSGGTVHDLY